MSKIKLEGHVVEDEGTDYLFKTNSVMDELTQLQQKYGIKFAISLEPFENSCFFDLFLVTEDEFKKSEFISEMEDIFKEYEITYIYKNVVD